MCSKILGGVGFFSVMFFFKNALLPHGCLFDDTDYEFGEQKDKLYRTVHKKFDKVWLNILSDM